MKCSWKSAAQEVLMRHFTFTPADLDAIRHERYHPPHVRVQQQMEVLWLKSQGFTHEDIASGFAGVVASAGGAVEPD